MTWADVAGRVASEVGGFVGGIIGLALLSSPVLVTWWVGATLTETWGAVWPSLALTATGWMTLLVGHHLTRFSRSSFDMRWRVLGVLAAAWLGAITWLATTPTVEWVILRGVE